MVHVRVSTCVHVACRVKTVTYCPYVVCGYVKLQSKRGKTSSKPNPPYIHMYVNTPSVFSPHLLELSLTDTVTVEDNPVGFEAGALVEVDEHLSHHGGQL